MNAENQDHREAGSHHRSRRSRRSSTTSRRIEVAVVVYAAVLATAGFAWQLWQWRQDKPVVAIETPQNILIVNAGGKDQPVRTRLRFVNYSARAVTVYAVDVHILMNPFGQSTAATWKLVPGSVTSTPIRIENGAVATWERMEQVEFDKRPSSVNFSFIGSIAIRLNTTAGNIERIFPIQVDYVVLQPGEASAALEHPEAP